MKKMQERIDAWWQIRTYEKMAEYYERLLASGFTSVETKIEEIKKWRGTK